MSAFDCVWPSDSEKCCTKIVCSISSFSTMPCNITCDSETGFHPCIIDYDPSSVMEKKYINITFAYSNYYHSPVNGDQCTCFAGNFAPINCFILRPTQTTLLSNTEVLATTIPFSTTTIINTTHSSIVTIVAPAVTITMLLCISIATGSALLCVLCMKKRMQDLTTLHSDSKDQQKYNTHIKYKHVYMYTLML